MEQIAAKVASLVVPPAQQHRGEKPSEEKGRQPGEARRRPLERSTVEVKGAGGILVLGGLLVTAAVAAGVAIVARRAQAKRTPASKKEKDEGLNGNDKLGESRIDGSAGIQEDDCVSVKPKSSSFEAVTCDGVEELGNGRELGWQQLDEKNWGKTDLRLQNGIGKKEIDKQPSLGEAEHGMIDKEDEKESELGMNQQQTEELVNTAKICLAREEEDKDSVNDNETELKKSIPAWGNGEKEDEPSLKQPHIDDAESNDEQSNTNKVNQSTDVEISKQGCENVRDRDEIFLPFLAESKESQFDMAECKSNVSRPVEPLTFKEIVEQNVEASPSELEEHQQQKEHEILTVESEDKVKQYQTEQISEPELALVNEEKEPKEPRFHMIESEPFALKEVKALSVGQQIEDVLNERGIEKFEEHIEEKEETEASPEGNEEKIEKETEESPEGEKDEEEIEDEKEPKASPEAEGEEIEEKNEAEVFPEEKEHEEIEDKKETESTSPEGEEKAEDEEAIEEKKEPGASVRREDDGTYNNQTQPHMIHSEVSTEEFSTTKKIEETDEKAQPASCAEEEEESDDTQTQTSQVIDEHKQQKEHEILIVQSEDKVNQHQTEQISGSELAEKEGVKALSIEQQTEHVLNEHDLAKVEEHVEEKEETEASPEGNEEKIEEKKEAEESPEGEEDEEEIEDEKEPKTSPEEEEKVEDEEAIEEKKEPESSVEGEDDGAYNNQTQPHIIHSEVSTEEFSTTKETEEINEKAQPASFAEEEEGSNNNQTRTHTADSQFSTEDYSTVKQVEKMDNAKEEPESFPEEEAQMRDEGSDSTPVSSAESNEAAISTAEVVDQGKILLHEVESKVSSDYLKSSGEVKVKVHVKKAEEKQQESIAERENTLDNMVHANKAEEKEEERKITKDEMQHQLMATIREKALMLEKLLMDIPDRLLVVLLVISVTMVLLHYVEPFSQLYQMISPSEENSKGI